MIKLSSKKYKLVGITKESFWKKLNGITVGQNTNPEISYSTQFDGNYNNKFGGRKKGDKFSIYLYRPISRGFRTEILAKGKLVENPGDKSLNIYVNYEIPFWSFLMFLSLAPMLFVALYFTYEPVGYLSVVLAFVIYVLIIRSNHNDINKEIEKQFKVFTQ
ncbi:hypothetical protein [Labilibacter marinus]|uniref:hypothetical protein n=1 Tax=Labilibacter marinus TaxID=1477105 RepID=UPI00094FA9D7|nr:hypothetical protein [Labilibacter marinus]